MRAALCRELGEPEVVAVEDVPTPVLGPTDVRVGVSAAAVNFPDVLVIAGTYQVKVLPPFVPGSELAGAVLEVGRDVPGLRVGDRVFGSTLVGAFAEEAVVAGASLTPVPGEVDDRVSAAFGVAHRTAFHVLRSIAEVAPGDEVIVLGAGGGVGLAAVELATLFGATVTAVASSDDRLAAAESAGARHLVHRGGGVDLRSALRDAVPGGADVVVDPVGGDAAEPALRSLRWGGRFVTVGYASGSIPRIPLNLVLLKGVEIRGFQFADFAAHRFEEMRRGDAELLELLATGRVSPHIGASFALEDVVGALRHVADGHAVGKVVIDVASS